MSVLSDWKNSLVTQEVFAEIRSRVEGLKEELAEQAGLDPRADALRVGAIRAYRDILEVELAQEETND